MKRPPFTLGGWKKNQTAVVRRSRALASRPKNWSQRKRYLSAGRALLALSNIQQDKPTKAKARADARYFFSLLRR